MSVQVLDEEDVRRIAREVAAVPALVSQRDVERVVGGLTRRAYLRGCARALWPSVREQRLRISRTADVLAYVEQRLQAREAKPANLNADAEAVAWARVGARRVSR